MALANKIAEFFNANELSAIDVRFMCRGFDSSYPLLSEFSNENIQMVQSGLLNTIQKYQEKFQSDKKPQT